MASTSASASVTDDDLALAEQQYEDGLDCLNADDFVSASDFFAQCLELKVTKYGERDPAVAPVYLKYAASLLGCARLQGDNLLGSLKTKAGKADGASTSKGDVKEKESAEEDDGGDLDLAWQMAELARLIFTEQKAAFAEEADIKLAEVHELLADISAERESFEDAVGDFEQALKYLDTCTPVDTRWQAEIHFKLSIPLELLDRVDDAIMHVNTAVAQLKHLVKQKKAEREELLANPPAAAADASTSDRDEKKPTSPEAASAAASEPKPEPTTEAEAPKAAEPGTAAATDAKESASAARDSDKKQGVEGEEAAGKGDEGEGEDDDEDAEEDEEEETELEAVERTIKELEGVLKDLQERKEELAAVKAQDKAVKEQLKAMLGGTASAASEFGAPSAEAIEVKPRPKAAKPAAAVQDLNPLGASNQNPKSEATKSETAGKPLTENNSQPEAKPQKKRTLEDIMGSSEEPGSNKAARQ